MPDPISIEYRIQHALNREQSLARVVDSLPNAVVITDEESAYDPNPFRGFLKCLQDPPGRKSHLCVLQDDVLPCRGFVAEVEKAVRERPDDVISLFVGGLSGRTKRDFLAALADGGRWSPVYFREIHHTVATLWPIPLVHEFLNWYETAKVPGPKPPRSDDAVVGYWARTQHKLFWATVPCLVEHPDDFPSTIRAHSRFGDKGRRAITFIDDL